MKILLASSIDDAARSELERHHDVVSKVGVGVDELSSLIADRDVLVFRSGVDVTDDVLKAAPNLRLIIRAGSGLDNIDLTTAKDLGVSVVRIPDPSARAVAEFTFALILALARQVALGDRLVRRGRWPKVDLSGTLLEGQTLGVLGAGNIGSVVCELGAVWGMEVLGFVTELPARLRPRLLRPGVDLVEMSTLASQADFLTIHVPLNTSTKGLIDATFIDGMKDSAYLINTSRGGIVDENALYDALTEGRLKGAALDVHENEGEGIVPRLAELPNVVLTPHIGAMADQTQHQIGNRILELLEAFQAGRLEAEVRITERVV